MGIGWGLHAIVMKNRHVAWDPHPEAEDRDPDEPIYFRSATTFKVTEPHRLHRPPVHVDYYEDAA
jgi:hypothetical protein